MTVDVEPVFDTVAARIFARTWARYTTKANF